MRKITIMLVCLLFAAQAAFAQKKVTGTVTSAEDGSGIPGVTVLVKGTTLGTTTNVNGQYEIAAQPNASLVFSVVGMKTIEVAIGDRSVINIIMEIDVYAIEELVVVGYGVQQRRDVSGSISTVRGDAIKTIPVQTFDQALQGKAAGVTLTVPNAVLGNPPVVRVRGYNSISGSSTPLYVIDGVPVITGDLSRTNAAFNPLGDINPADIASIEILKDASATAIYGSRAANGVILITTKRGASGKVVVNYDANMGWSSPYRLYDLMNAEQYVHTKNLARVNANATPHEAYFLNYDKDGKLIDTDWNDYVYQTGFQHSHSLNVSGGSQSTSYYLSVGYSNNDGIIKTNNYERKSARLNLDHKLNKWLSLGANINFTNAFTNAPNTGSIAGSNFSTAGAGRLAFVTAPNVPAFLNDGTYNIDYAGNRVGLLNNLQPVGFFHPVFVQDKNYGKVNSDRLMSTLYANVDILKGLTYRFAFGYDLSAVESKTFWHPNHGDGKTRGGDAFNYLDRRNRWNITNTLNYGTTLVDKLNLKVLLGSEEQYTEFDGWSGAKSGLADAFFGDYQGSFTTPQQPPTALLEENYFTSFFGRVNVDWNRKYYVEFSARRDGFSGLAAGNKYGNFSGFGVMWNISNEEFLKDSRFIEIISDLRLKASFGKVGNISGVGNYASLFLYGAGTYNQQGTLFFNQAGNADLEWETSNKFDMGLAFAILNDKIQFDINYFKNDIDGLILNVPQSPSKGIPDNRLPMNIGTMFNEGIELTVASYNINTAKFKWNTNFNFSYLKNEVTALADGVPFLAGVTQLETTNRTLVGYPLGNIWGVQTAGVDPETGRRIFIKRTKDPVTGAITTSKVFYGHGTNWPAGQAGWRNEDGTVSRAIDISNDGVVLGSPIPKFFGGLDNTIQFMDFDFSLGLTYAFDFVVYNGSKAGLRDQRNWNNEAYVYENYWREAGQVTDIPKPVWGDNVSNGSSMVQSQNVEKGDFLKVRNLSLGYTLKNRYLKEANITSLRIYTQLFNAYTFTGYSGADPEISSMGDTNLVPGVDRNTVPQARTISFGVNINF